MQQRRRDSNFFVTALVFRESDSWHSFYHMDFMYMHKLA